MARVHRICIPLRCLEGINAPDSRHLRLDPFFLPVTDTGCPERRLQGFEKMPTTKGGGGTAVVLGYFLRPVVGKFHSFSLTRTAKRLRTESIRQGGANVVSHFLRYHLGVYGTPVPLMLKRFAEPSDAVEDYCLHFHTSRAVGIPNGLDPEVVVDILAVFVNVGIAGNACRWEIEMFRGLPFPVFRHR